MRHSRARAPTRAVGQLPRADMCQARDGAPRRWMRYHILLSPTGVTAALANAGGEFVERAASDESVRPLLVHPPFTNPSRDAIMRFVGVVQAGAAEAAEAVAAKAAANAATRAEKAAATNAAKAAAKKATETAKAEAVAAAKEEAAAVVAARAAAEAKAAAEKAAAEAAAKTAAPAK